MNQKQTALSADVLFDQMRTLICTPEGSGSECFERWLDLQSDFFDHLGLPMTVDNVGTFAECLTMGRSLNEFKLLAEPFPRSEILGSETRLRDYLDAAEIGFDEIPFSIVAYFRAPTHIYTIQMAKAWYDGTLSFEMMKTRFRQCQGDSSLLAVMGYQLLTIKAEEGD